ncbi:MAG: cyclodeaminase/cyclohydrolase family protein [Firmicutes bacterium]|nr:cyclodeaminase/cyclohydrolase family protein [Bacillota bacterium]
MKLVKLTVEEFINEIDSKSPAPGGGSVSALSSTLGVSLARMVGHLTVGKKKYLALSPEIQMEFLDVQKELITIKDELIALIDKDTDAFNLIMKAYQMPKETEQQIKQRNEKIQEGTNEAILTPILVSSLSISALHQFPFLIQYGNKQTISDLGVAIMSLAVGVEGACMNVLINLTSLDDKIAANQYKTQVNSMLKTAHELRDQLLKSIYQILNKD